MFARDCISVMQNPGASVAAVSEAGQWLMVLLYGGTPTDTLSHLYYIHYYKLLLVHQFQAERLPPSQGAAHYHAVCVHLQVIEWESLGHIALKPCHLGWQSENRILIPIQTDDAVAPDELLKFVRCQCEKDCVSLLCWCRKNGLKYVITCSHWHGGENCSNSDRVHLEVSDVDSDTETSAPVYVLGQDIGYGDEEIVEYV